MGLASPFGVPDVTLRGPGASGPAPAWPSLMRPPYTSPGAEVPGAPEGGDVPLRGGEPRGRRCAETRRGTSKCRAGPAVFVMQGWLGNELPLPQNGLHKGPTTPWPQPRAPGGGSARPGWAAGDEPR